MHHLPYFHIQSDEISPEFEAMPESDSVNTNGPRMWYESSEEEEETEEDNAEEDNNMQTSTGGFDGHICYL